MNSIIKKVAICGGSGSSLLPKIIGKADVFVSGDFTYHTLLDSKIPIIDAGHFYTEQPVLQKLKDELEDLPLDVSIVGIEDHDIKREMFL